MPPVPRSLGLGLVSLLIGVPGTDYYVIRVSRIRQYRGVLAHIPVDLHARLYFVDQKKRNRSSGEKLYLSHEIHSTYPSAVIRPPRTVTDAHLGLAPQPGPRRQSDPTTHQRRRGPTAHHERPRACPPTWRISTRTKRPLGPSCRWNRDCDPFGRDGEGSKHKCLCQPYSGCRLPVAPTRRLITELDGSRTTKLRNGQTAAQTLGRSRRLRPAGR